MSAQIAIITGLSGAGRSTAAKCMEDLGWFVVDNLPPALLGTMADLGDRAGGTVDRIAVVVDVRGRAFFDDLRQALTDLRARNVMLRVVFLEASDEALVRRFESVRRPHPLQEGRRSGEKAAARLLEGITAERELMRDLLGEADFVLDTSNLNVHELRAAIDAQFATESQNRLRATVVSFGYKYGLPVDADLVIDCRFLANPHWDPALRAHNGTEDVVRDAVMGSEGAREFLDGYAAVLRTVTAGYAREGKRWMTLAVGCTGGKHRSVAMAAQLATVLEADGVDVRLMHRDLGRE